jgi:hypothetical protein
MVSSSISPDEMKFVLELISQAKAHGIVEVQYKDLRLRLSLQAQQTGSGPVQATRAPAPQWNTAIKIPE